MTRVCLVGDREVTLQYELLSRETARDGLAAYDLREPFENSVAVETVSLGAAVALLNDLDWYLVRFVEDALVFEPSVCEDEWLSRDLASAIRDGTIDADDTGRFLKVYGLEYPGSTEQDREDSADDTERRGSGGPDNTATHGNGAESTEQKEQNEQSQRQEQNEQREIQPPRLVEPMFVTRTGETLPEYDLRDVDETLLVRVTEDEFGA